MNSPVISPLQVENSPSQFASDKGNGRSPGAGPTYGFTADVLTCALVLAGTATPTSEQLDNALQQLYSAGGAPTVAEVLAGGWLVATVDRKRLRVPPVPVAELFGRLAPQNSVVSHELLGTGLKTPHGFINPADEPSADYLPAGSIDVPTQPRFSYFIGPIYNTRPRAAITVADLHGVIIAPPRGLRERAEAVRAEYQRKGKTPLYTKLKCGLDYFSSGGIFSRRADEAVLVESGLLTLDFDKLNGRVAEARGQLMTDAALAPALALVFVSPSGDGLKAVLAGDPRRSRANNYERLARHLTRRYGWGPTLDSKTADMSRACFLSHDPTAWLAPDYSPLPQPR